MDMPFDSTTTTMTTASTTTTRLPRIQNDFCSMCSEMVNVQDLITDYCRSSIVFRSRLKKFDQVSKYLIFDKKKHRYFKTPTSKRQTQLKFYGEKCSCMRLNEPMIVFVSSSHTDTIIRFISIKSNHKTFQLFRQIIGLRKPRCKI
ncbi:unnamed protein product [Didymodactylos carnosus]|uniref:Uncharacterized protein n=2 Tax=Didymodactylos carnosus TaxID=1234261 RepID=A0A813U6R1_9BILA|nr:unnamed protein product [Didymodactylos carnosus]CAF3604914.1 unnamed protein product [Didymodactylos carnosus]